MKKKAIIWGAGKAGRGVYAGIFSEAGYEIVFTDHDRTLIDTLNGQKEYAVYRRKCDGSDQKFSVNGYTALHTSQKEALKDAAGNCNIIVLSPAAADIETAGRELAALIAQRAAGRVENPLNILVCSNAPDAPARLKAAAFSELNRPEREYFERCVGLAETVTAAEALEPGPDTLGLDSLSVLTLGRGEVMVSRSALIGAEPDCPGISFKDDISAEALRKRYTYGIVRQAFACMGAAKGYRLMSDCIGDEKVRTAVALALNEAGEALTAASGFSAEEMDAWNKEVMRCYDYRMQGEISEYTGEEAVHRLADAAVLCRNQRIWPYHLTRAVAYAFLCPAGPNAILREYAEFYGAKAAAQKYCGMEREPELLQLIQRHYDLAAQGGEEEESKVALMKKAYHLGFMSELKYKGCAQCTLQAFFQLSGEVNETLFQSASGFSGGMAISGDGVCGGYSGGLMVMGSIVGRRYHEMMQNGDKEAQYVSYMMAQKLRERFLETYGSVICSDIHRQIFGKAFCLRTKAVRNEFEAAGAHTGKCTNVVGTACAYIAEILFDAGYPDMASVTKKST